MLHHNTCTTIALLVSVLTSQTFADVTNIVIPPGACLLVTGSSVNVRSAPCGSTILGSALQGEDYIFQGGRETCSLSGTTYNFIEIDFNGQSGWMAGIYLQIEESGNCGTAIYPSPEFRAAWIATVANIDWPASSSESVATQQAEMDNYINIFSSMNMNAIVFQVRPVADAMYASSIEPWSRYLTGTQGTPPSPLWDPLEYTIEAAHAVGMEVHAWLNPYRANMSPSCTSGLASNNMAIQYPEHAKVYGSYCWMDPGAEVIVQRLVDVVQDIITRYDIDGIHFDDYFYPYPTSEPFPDDETYAAYLAGGGTMSRDDWRRNNVNEMIERVYDLITTTAPGVAFTISPFGLYRPGNSAEGMPSPITGMDPYSELYADAKYWLQQGLVDIMAPQLYWRIDPPGQSFPSLLDWWVTENTQGRYIFPGLGMYRIEPGEGDWPVSEIQTQIDLSRIYHDDQCQGHIHFSAKYFRDNTKNVVDDLSSYSYPNMVTLPTYPWKNFRKPVRPSGLHVVGESGLRWLPDTSGTTRFWALYHRTGQAWDLIKIVDAKTTSVKDLTPGTYALRAMNKAHDLSDPEVISLTSPLASA